MNTRDTASELRRMIRWARRAAVNPWLDTYGEHRARARHELIAYEHAYWLVTGKRHLSGNERNR